MKGKLNTNEFLMFLQSIELSLNQDDLETALLEMDDNNDNEVKYRVYRKVI